jgi:glycosyltransferase involved in cell wall biosynthesis
MYVVIPAFNEEKNIGRVIRDLFEHGPDDIKIIVVDDGSVDKSAKIAKKEGAIVLRHKINRGQGAALQTGHQYVLLQDADLIVDFDADGQFNPEDIIPALKALQKNNADVLLGSRFLDSRSQIPWLKRYIILPISRLINYLFTGVRLTDAHNGFRVLSRKALEIINITQDKMAHNTEIVRQIKKHNLKFIEFPVEVRYSEFGQGVGGGVRILRDLMMEKMLK